MFDYKWTKWKSIDPKLKGGRCLACNKITDYALLLWADNQTEENIPSANASCFNSACSKEAAQ